MYANLRPTACAIFLLIGVTSAIALTLERSSASLVLGRPLDFNVQATVSGGEDTASLCLEADVFQADTLINPVRVKIQLLKTGSVGLSTLRVSSSTIVEEPVLTVVIRYGCLSKNFRRYVLFADPPASMNEAAQIIKRDSAYGMSQPAQVASTNLISQMDGDVSRNVAPLSNKRFTSVAAGAVTVSRRSGPVIPVKNTKPRLQLDGADSTLEPTVRLKSTLGLFVVPSEFSSVKREEAAALWRVISAQSDDLRQDVQRLTALHAETLALRESSSKSSAETARLSIQLKEAENSKYQNSFVYGLTALLALLLGSFVLLRFGWRSETSKPAWWKPRRDNDNLDDERNSTKLKESPRPKVVVRESGPVASSDVRSITRLGDRKEHEALPTEPRFKPSEFAYATNNGQGNPRGVNVEELFDIQQQADFFISLGQYDQAVEVLQNHINENSQTSPLVYLDLLKLYHRQDKRTEYHDLTLEFTRLFNADVPVFDAFQDRTRGLETYEAKLSQITSSWHTDTILKIIEDSVFRGVGNNSETFDLEAYRELLLLHSIAKDLSENQIIESDPTDQILRPNLGLLNVATPLGGFSPGNFSQTIPQKLTPIINLLSAETPYNNVRSGTFQKPVGARIGLDIDLTAISNTLMVDKLSAIPEKLSPEESGQNSDSGLIEFDLDSFAISDNTKSPINK